MRDRIEPTAELLAGRYHLLELLGTGGSGSTYRAIRTRDGVEVAIKVLSLRHLQDWQQLQLFEREAQILAQLDHPQIPQYLEYFHIDTPTDRAFYIVQQLAPGKPLNLLVESGWRGTEAEITSIASQILAILQYLQAQSPPLIHRDLKPHNIVRNDDGRVFLVDFGAVQETYNNTLLASHTVAGTYGYMAPEQFRGRATPASDLYGLGATILYLLTHRSPADLPQERLKVSFRAHVSINDRFADWLETMLEPNEVDRFPSAKQAHKALNSKFYRRSSVDRQIKFPVRGLSIAAIFLAIFSAYVHEYRYAIAKTMGMQANLCPAIERGDFQSLHSYVNQGGDLNATVQILPSGRYGKAKTQKGETDVLLNEYGSLLRCALLHERSEIARYLVQQGADLTDLITNSVKKRKHLKHKLTEVTNDEVIEFLLAAKADLNKQDSQGQTPLGMVIKSKNYNLARRIIAHAAATNNRIYEDKTLPERVINSIHNRDWETIDTDEYIELLRDLIKIRPSTRAEDLMQIVQNLQEIDRNSNIFQQLMAVYTQVDLNKADSTGNRPLHTAIRHNYKMAEVLIARGVDVNVRNNVGETPVTIASALDIGRAPEPKIKLLLKHGANVNDRDRNGRTPLMLVTTSSRSPEIVELLLKAGANVNARDRSGRNAIALNSTHSKDYRIDRLLKAYQKQSIEQKS
jgi:serine/threonine protein kinase